jgi:hypothetical protein
VFPQETAGFRAKRPGNPICVEPGVILRLSGKVFLITAACVSCAARLHSQRAITPMAATQEVNRCLSVMRAASSRKGGSRDTLPQRKVDQLSCSGRVPR